jgi:hypothetical protein
VDHKSSPWDGPRRLPLDQLRRKTRPMQRSSGRETCNAAADHQDPIDLCHVSLRFQ